MNKLGVVIGVTALLIGQTALATVQKGQYSVTPMGVYYSLSSARELDNGGGFGVGLAHYFSNQWAMELDLSAFGSKQKKGEKKSVNGSYVTLNGLYYFREGKAFQPYVSFGVGMVHFSRTVDNDTKTQPNLGVGAGVSYFIDKSIALRAGANDYYSFTNDGNNDIGVNAGISFFFGGSSSESGSSQKILSGHQPEGGNADNRIYLRGVVILPNEPAAQGTTKQEDQAVASEANANGPVVKAETKSAEKAKPAQLPVHPQKPKAESGHHIKPAAIKQSQPAKEAEPDYSLYD